MDKITQWIALPVLPGLDFTLLKHPFAAAKPPHHRVPDTGIWHSRCHISHKRWAQRPSSLVHLWHSTAAELAGTDPPFCHHRCMSSVLNSHLFQRRAGCSQGTCTHHQPCLNTPTSSPHVQKTFTSVFSFASNLNQQAEDR